MKTEIVPVKKTEINVSPVNDYIVMDRKELAHNLHASIKVGVGLLTKKTKFQAADYEKVKVMKSLSSFVNAGVAMIQQEAAQQRIELVKARMTNMGYEVKNPKRLTNNRKRKVQIV